MAKTNETEQRPSDVADGVVLRAILAVLVDERESRTPDAGQIRSELVLADVGIDYRDIASLLGKKPDAVRMLLSRARRTPDKKGS